MSRRRFLADAGAGAAALAWSGSAAAAARRSTAARRVRDSVVVRWSDAALEGVRESKLGPPMVSRALAIVHTCMYDAWAAYDRDAAGTTLGGTLRRPPRERTLANKRSAISFAAHRAACELFPASRAGVFDPLLAELGYDPRDASTDTTTATGIGNVCAQAVIDGRRDDGANQVGGYADTTGYRSPNLPLDPAQPLDPSTVRDPSAWQPLRYVDATGTQVTQGFLGAQWLNVRPFGLSSGSALRSSTGPARFGSEQYAAQAQQLLDLSATLTDEQKMIAEYWKDGPHSETPPGHWALHAQYVARRDEHGDGERGVDLDVKLFFALANAIFDAGICAWDAKATFGSVRPITAIRYLYQGQQVLAWGGPGRGTESIAGGAWLPYQPSTFPTPPFPEYSSGHSNFSAAGAEILRRFTRSDRFGASVTLAAGSSEIEPGLVPARDVNLSWRTFSDAADQAGISRRYGGIHFEQGDLDGRATGTTAAANAWRKAVALFGGAPPPR